MAYLLCKQHPDAARIGQRTELIFGSAFIGRCAFSDIRVNEPGLPGKALELRRLHDGQYAAIPSGACEALRNGERIESLQVLDEGDQIQVGRAVFEFCPEADAVAKGETRERDTGERTSLVQAMLRLVFGTLASRVLGLAREIVMAAYFGAGAAMDVFIVAFTIPNLFRRVFGEAAMESAFLPTFKTFLSRGEKREGWRLASTVCNVLTLLLVGVVVLLYLLAPLVVKVLAPGFSPELAGQTIRLTRLMLPFTLFIGVAAFLGSLLLAKGRYFAYSLAPTMFNLGAILGIVLFYKSWGLFSLAAGIVLGGAGQMLAQVHGFRRNGDADTGYRPVIDWHHPGGKKVLSLTGPILLTSMIDKVGEASKRIIASLLMTGSIAALSYAFRLIHLPFSIIGLALSRAVLPFLAEQNALNDLKTFRAHLVRGLNLCAFLMIPTSVGVAVLAVPMIETLFAHGAWLKTNEDATAMTARAIIFYAAGLWAMSTVSILYRAFHAMLDTRAPLRASIYGFFINISLSICLALTPLAHAGLALAVSVDYLAQVGLMLRELRRKFAAAGEAFEVSSVLRPLVPVGAASALMGLAVGCASAAWWPGTTAGIVHRALVLAVLVGIGAAVYAVASLAFGVPEARAISKSIRGRLLSGTGRG